MRRQFLFFINMKFLLCFIFCCCLCQLSLAQIDPVKYKTYTSIDEALQSTEPVRSISFRDKEMFNLPPQLGKMKDVFFLNIMSNKLEKMEQVLFELEKLEILNANKNSFKYIPDEISNLKSIHTLFLALILLRNSILK